MLSRTLICAIAPVFIIASFNAVILLRSGASTVATELLSNLVFEDYWSCGDLVRVGGFNSVFESNAGDDLGEIIKAA